MKNIIKFNLLLIFLLLSFCKDTKEVVKEKPPEKSGNLVSQTVDSFEKKFGTHSGKRRNHISGFCFFGSFQQKDAKIKELSKSGIFSEKPLSVVGRFSHKGGVKKDESKPGEYGMAFEISLPDGQSHNFSMNTLDFFPVSTPEGFLQLMQAKVSGKAEDFAKLKEDHPEFKNYKSHYKNKPKQLKSYANHQFNSVNSFYLEDDNGKKTAIRWAFVPKNETVEIDTSKSVDFYQDLENALSKKPLKWDMIVSIANENDDINNAALMWEGEHKQITAATLIVDKVEKTGACDDKNFDPLAMSNGIVPSDDPVLKFRSPAYAVTFAKRIVEKNKQ